MTGERSLTPARLAEFASSFGDLESRWVNGEISHAEAEVGCEMLRVDLTAAAVAGYRADNGKPLRGDDRSAIYQRSKRLIDRLHQFSIAIQIFQESLRSDDASPQERRANWERELDNYSQSAWSAREQKPDTPRAEPLSPTRLASFVEGFETLKRDWLSGAISHEDAESKRLSLYQALNRARNVGYCTDSGEALMPENWNAIRREGDILGAAFIVLRNAVELSKKELLGGDDAGQVRRLNWSRALDDSPERRRPGRFF